MNEQDGPSSASLFKPVPLEQHRCSAASVVQHIAQAKVDWMRDPFTFSRVVIERERRTYRERILMRKQKLIQGTATITAGQVVPQPERAPPDHSPLSSRPTTITSQHATNDARSIAAALLQRLRASAWARDRLNILLDPWQVRVADAGAGSQALALCHRQSGKSFVGAIVLAHEIEQRGSTNLVLAPTVRQSSESIRMVKQFLLQAGCRLLVDNTFSLELENGGRVLAMPGASDASIRGYSVSGCLLFDEAARITDDLYAAARPMRARFPASRTIALSTPWAKQGWFYEICEGDPARAIGWLVVRADPATTGRLSDQFLATERAAMNPGEFRREYELEFLDTSGAGFFSPETLATLFDRRPDNGDVDNTESADPVVARAPMFGAWMEHGMLQPPFGKSRNRRGLPA